MVHSYVRLRVFSNTFFEEVFFFLETNCFHPLKRVAAIVVLTAAKVDKKSVSTKLDAAAHHSSVYPDEFNKKGIGIKLHFNVHYVANNLDNVGLRMAINQFGVKETCKVTIKSFVMTDKFVA